MAKRFGVAILAVLAIMASVAMAAEYIVGDAQGWNISVDYTKWAAGKEFYVGDVLVFNYDKSKDNVIELKSGPDFQNCIPLGENILNTGNDRVALVAPGKWWFISGVASHCTNFSQKLVVGVEGTSPPGATPSPGANPPGIPWTPVSVSNSGNGLTDRSWSWVHGFVAASVTVAMAVVLA